MSWQSKATGLVLLVMTALLASTAHAQFDSGQLTGSVRDAQGAVVPGASVKITHEATGVERTVVSDRSGYFVVPALTPGTYSVEVQLDGFRTFLKKGIKLDAASRVQVDASLELGPKTETVTVIGESTPLQTSTGQIAKTIEAKQIEDMMLNGRNPFMLAALKPGIRGVSIGQFSPNSPFVAQGININGSRGDENQITYDGVTAVRTRSSVASIGVPNVDSLQEIQVLTASYLPEYGRSSGGQIRFVTKSGTRDFHGGFYGFFRDESLDANSWGRNRSTVASQNSGPQPYGFKQFGYDLAGPLYIPGSFNSGKDKLFFFWGQEWIRRDNPETLTATVPTERMRRGDFSELLATNTFYNRTYTINDPLTGQPFPGNVIPQNRLSPNGLAFLNMYPMPVPGFQSGTSNWTMEFNRPESSRKDTVRLDFHPDTKHRISARFSHYDWKFLSRHDPFAQVLSDWHLPNDAAALNWSWSLSPNVLNEMTAGFSQDRVFINLSKKTDGYKRSRWGITYPYIFPGTKEDEDKIPTLAVGGISSIDASPYPAFSKGPIYQLSNNLTFLKGRHTFKAGISIEYSGEDDLDQINVSGQPGDTNNQNGRFEFSDGRTGGTGNSIANMAMGLFNNYSEIGKKSLTKWRSLGIDLFVQDSWKARDDLTLEYGARYVYWPPWRAQCNNIATFDARYYDTSRAATIDRSTGAVLGGDRFNGIVLPGTGFPSECAGQIEAAGNPEYQRLFVGLPRGFAPTHSTVFEPRAGVAWQLNEKTVLRVGGGVFHNRVTLNDSTLLGGNPPIQFKVGVTNGVVDQPTGATQQTFPYVMTAQDPEFTHPTAYNWSLSVQRLLPWSMVVDLTYVGRVGTHLQRERNINQLAPGTIQANPGVNVNALRPYKGFGVIRLSENAGRSEYNGLQFNLERRFRNGLGFGVAYTWSRSEDNGDGKRDTLYNAYDDRGYWGPSGFDRTHFGNFHYIYELPLFRAQDNALARILGGWQVSGVAAFTSGGPFWVGRGDDRAGVGDSQRQPWNVVGNPNSANKGFSTNPTGENADQNFWINKDAFAQPAAGTFGDSPRNNLRNPWSWTWDTSLIKTVRLNNRGHRVQLRLEVFNVLNHPNWGGVSNDPTSATFGRVTTKDGNRQIQLGAKFAF